MVNMKKKKNERGDTGKGPVDKRFGDKQNNGEHKGITDSRFESVHSDPRFQNVPTNKSKVHIDSRFSSAFSDKRFNTSRAPCDKRGKPKPQNKSDSNPLKDYYHIEKEEDEAKSQDHDESDENIDAETSDSKDYVESESSDTSDDDDSMVIESGAEEDVENVPVIDKSTRRLAVVNLDWQNIKAEDLFVLMNSALRKGEQILSVDVYPSEFGIKCMQEEAARGPTALLGAKNGEDDENENENDEIDDDSSDDETDDENIGDEIGDENSGEENDDENTVDEIDNENSSDGFDDESSSGEFDDEDSSDEIDDERIREYEKSKLRYYYAVVVCDSVSTAENLYKTLDGVEIVRSSNKLDMRFIEDSTEFKHPPRETATELPANYEGLNFCTRALQHSKVESTYDEEDEPQRAKKLKRSFNDDQLAEIDLKEFLASDDSDDEEEHIDATEPQSDKKQKTIDKYRVLLSGNADEGEDGNEDLDMEVTFNTGLEDLSKRILEKKDKLSETVWEKHLRERDEKKKARKNKSRHSSSDDESSDDNDTDKAKIQEPDDFFVEPSPVVKKGKPSRKVKENNKEEASRAELELLLADDKGEKKVKGYNLKAKKPKGKKDKQVSNVNNIPDTDYDDPRFTALFKSSQYALDPTDPQFKRSAAYARQLEQKQHQTEPEVPSDFEMNKKKKAKVEELPSNEKHELSALLKSIKMKTKQDWLLSNSKNARKDDSSTLEPPVKKKSKKVMF